MLHSKIVKNRELPPNVFGRHRGSLELTVEEIRWKSKSYPAIELKVKWWGDDSGAKINIKSTCNKKGALGNLSYKVNTNYELFKSYLQNSEPIEIQVYSLKTNTLIGSTKIELPAKIKTFNRLGEDCSVKTNTQIASSRFFCLGDLILSFKLQYFLNQNMTKPVKPLVLKTPAEQEHPCSRASGIKECVVMKPVSRCKENIPKIVDFELPKPKSAVSPTTSYKELNSAKKLSILSYLTGERMNRDDESKILKEIVSISPASSIIEALDKISPKSEHEKLYEMVDSIRIFLSTFKSSSAGSLELQYLNKGEKMAFICLVSSTLFSQKERIKITSLTQETFVSDAIFNAEVINRVTLPQTSSRAENELVFNFYLKAFGRQEAIFVGSAQVKLCEMINRKFGCSKKCPVKNDCGLTIGSINIKLELGSKGIHFGENLIDAYSGDKENKTILSDDDSDIFVRDHRVKFKKPVYRSRPTTSNGDTSNEKSSKSKVTQTDPSAESSNSNNSGNSSNSRVEPKKNGEKMLVDQEKPVAPITENAKILSGLLFVEQMRVSKETPQNEYFINYNGFWNGCLETTKTCPAGNLNHLKSFVTVCNDTFLKSVQNSQLELKLWEKTKDQPEKLIAVTKLPLHQFYIAFRDVVMIEHLSTNILPVISIDGWTNLNSPLSSEYFGQMKVLLAVGSQNQIEYLKVSRNLEALSLQQPIIPIPIPVHKEMETQTNGSHDQMKDKLSAFIANLGNKQATPRIDSLGDSPKNSVFKLPSLPVSNISSTSNLLDNLQQALMKPPTDDGTFVAPPAPFEFTPQPNEVSTGAIQVDGLETFRILIDIEEAIHLPKIMVHKKHNRNRKKPGHQQLSNEIEPSAYATFDAALASTLNDETKHLLPPNIVKSHEGYVYTTNVVERSSTPKWNKTFDVTLPVDMMINPEKRFILKVWRKLTHDLPQCRLSPSPLEDAVVGFTAIDLSIFLSGMQTISGWYNIMDFSSRVNGQIKVNLKPLESVAKYRQPLPLLSPLTLNVDTGNDPNSPSSILGRTLKRKFTELEEITQRLKARLFDVTGDENFDPDDEFERDLNTTVDEMEDDEFEWFKGGQNGLGFNEHANHFQSALTTNPTNALNSSQPQPSTSSQCHELTQQTRAVSGMSQQQQNELSLENLLKQYDLDTIINPNIFKNLMDPTLATSESTPNLHENPADNACLIDLDESSSAVSDLSNDQVQNIQNALQNASINEQSRPVPEGSNNSRKE